MTFAERIRMKAENNKLIPKVSVFKGMSNSDKEAFTLNTRKRKASVSNSSCSSYNDKENKNRNTK